LFGPTGIALAALESHSTDVLKILTVSNTVSGYVPWVVAHVQPP